MASASGDRIDGGLGSDTVSYAAVTAGVVVNLATGTADPVSGTQIGHDTLISIENVTTGSGDDTLIGNAANNVLNGGTGFNIFRGGAGNDTLIQTASTAVRDGGVAEYTDATGPITVVMGSAGAITMAP